MRPAAAVAIALLVACADFELVPIQARADPLLVITVSAEQRLDTTQYIVGAFFDPGLDSVTGSPIDAGTYLVVVEDSVLSPKLDHTSTGHTVFTYIWMHDLGPRQSLDTVHLQLPAFGPPPLTAFELRIPVPRRLDDTVVSVAGDVLRLHVSPSVPGSWGVTGLEMFWQTEIRPDCSGSSVPQLRVESDGTYPAEVELPRALFATAVDSTMACFTASTHYQSSTAPYPTDIRTIARIMWRVRIP